MGRDGKLSLKEKLSGAFIKAGPIPVEPLERATKLWTPKEATLIGRSLRKKGGIEYGYT